MSTSIVRLSESAFHEILQFVAATSRMAERKPLVDSLRTLASRVLNLDEMVIGRCGGDWNADRRDRCSHFDPMMSMSETKPKGERSPCSSGATASSSCGGARGAANATFQNNEPAGRVVVCHRHTLDAPSLCIVSSAKRRSHEELSTLLKTLLPYVDEAFRRLDPEGSTVSAGEFDESGSDSLLIPLTSREREVLHWTAQGKGCWETGHIVGISERTVKFHLQNAVVKLDAMNKTHAATKAAMLGLLP